ncbi:MAG TPA: histidine kinase dimerization/phospho-acceptor domain-containing protein [Alphaproteobacteria bacterium]|nr:histidine kinase dimerization/phospho-acceptor domain-containing protein [Alphaproteobacteria bacterium]
MSEAERLAELVAYCGPDIGPDPRFDRIAALARSALDAPMAMVNLIAATEQISLAQAGVALRTLPRSEAVCNVVVATAAPLVVPDLAADPRFAALGAVAEGLRFYAGAPLATPTGQILGALCVLDRQPRDDFDAGRLATLQALAGLAMDQLALHRSLDAARAAEDAKAALLSTLSHEIRTPLNAILGFSELLAKAGLPPEAERRAGLIHRAGRELDALLGAVLDYAELQGPRNAGPSVALRIPDLLRECCDAAAASGGGVRFAPSWAAGAEAPLAGDAVRLRQGLTRLLQHAAANAAAGTVTVSAAIDGRQGDAALCAFEVGGTAAVPPERIATLFEPFADGGLHLAIARRIARLLGGELEAVGQPGGGFRMVVPLAAGAAPAAPGTAVAGGPAPLRLLVLGDGVFDRELLRAVLERLGHRPVVGGLAEAAALAGGGYDGAFVDLAAPGGGDAAGRALAALRARPAPIVAILPGAPGGAPPEGAAAALWKPLDVAALAALLDRLRPAG